ELCGHVPDFAAGGGQPDLPPRGGVLGGAALHLGAGCRVHRRQPHGGGGDAALHPYDLGDLYFVPPVRLPASQGEKPADTRLRRGRAARPASKGGEGDGPRPGVTAPPPRQYAKRKREPDGSRFTLFNFDFITSSAASPAM